MHSMDGWGDSDQHESHRRTGQAEGRPGSTSSKHVQRVMFRHGSWLSGWLDTMDSQRLQLDSGIDQFYRGMRDATVRNRLVHCGFVLSLVLEEELYLARGQALPG